MNANPVFQRAALHLARPGSTQGVHPTPATLRDDYERWYTEPIPNNRMVLALKSGIDSEISWALERLCRLCQNEQFVLRALPGLTEALFEWPSWFVKGGYLEMTGQTALFALSRDLEQWTRHASECMFVLRNAACNPVNAQELVGRRTTQELILLALHRLKPDSDIHTEFLLDVVDLLQSISSTSVLPPPDSHVFANPVPPLLEIAGMSTDRGLILSSMETLHLLFSNPPNMVHLTPSSPALSAAIRYLPLVDDKPLVSASLNYLYTHLSHPPMTKAFLQSPELKSTLRLLVLVMLAEQENEQISEVVPGLVHTAPSQETLNTRMHELTQEEFDRLLPMPEPERCFEWMKIMFQPDDNGELTQVEFWNLYKDVFAAHQDQYPALPASDVIKNVSIVFTSAVAMVLPQQRFVVRGVSRRRENSDRLQCHWDRGQCAETPLTSPGDLYEHILQAHVDSHPEPKVPCTWANCTHGAMHKPRIRGHILTHLPSSQPPPKYPGQEENITLPYEGFPHPIPNPTLRPVPPLRSAVISYPVPINEPSSSALTALLCIRILYRVSFASSEAAPRVDEDHFGFPGVIEEVGEKEGDEEISWGSETEREGERRGKKAFVYVRHLLEGLSLRDETLMVWIKEMVDAGLSVTTGPALGQDSCDMDALAGPRAVGTETPLAHNPSMLSVATTPHWSQ